MKALFTSLAALFITAITYSQPGTLDLTFGDKGFVADDGISATYVIVQQPDGKLLTAGGYNDQQFNGKGNLARFLPDGTLDSSFGKNGFAGYPPGGGIFGIALQKDGKFAEVGSLLIGGDPHPHYFVARLKEDGTFDSTFGVNGFCFIPDFADASGYGQIAMQTDGSFIINGAGQTNLQNQQPTYSLLCHIFADGTFDYGFGNGGRALNKSLISTNNGALAIQPDGKILQAGFNDGGGYQYRDYVLCRYHAGGSLDETFGNAGVVVTQGINGEDIPNGLVVQPDGKVVMGGYSGGNNNVYYMAALRYNTDGTLDNSFGNKGKSFVLFPGRSAYATALLRQEDGKLILSGRAEHDYFYSDIALCRLNTDGSIDSAFAVNGRQLAHYAGSNIAQGYCATLQSDGKIVTGGSYYDEETNYESYLLVRFNGDKSQPPLVARLKRFLHNHGIGWQGLEGKAVSYYSIQYSPTNKGFTEKGRVSGAGSSPFRQYDYSVTDAGQYRVVAVDGKGHKTFSNPVTVSGADIAAQASIYPNPARSYITVQGLDGNETANISIRDAGGNILARGVSMGSGQYRSPLSSHMQPGTYYVNITTGSKTQTLPFVKE